MQSKQGCCVGRCRYGLAMSTDHDAVEFALLHPTGTLEFVQAPASDALLRTVREHIPELGTQGMGRLRAWFTDDFTGLPPNPLADSVISGLGYRHPTGWRGPVALTMEEASDGTTFSLHGNVRAAIEDLAHVR